MKKKSFPLFSRVPLTSNLLSFPLLSFPLGYRIILVWWSRAFLNITFLYLLGICMMCISVDTWVLQHMCGGQRSTRRRQFSLELCHQAWWQVPSLGEPMVCFSVLFRSLLAVLVALFWHKESSFA